MVVPTSILVAGFYRREESAVGIIVGVFVPMRGQRPLVVGHPVASIVIVVAVVVIVVVFVEITDE